MTSDFQEPFGSVKAEPWARRESGKVSLALCELCPLWGQLGYRISIPPFTRFSAGRAGAPSKAAPHAGQGGLRAQVSPGHWDSRGHGS